MNLFFDVVSIANLQFYYILSGTLIPNKENADFIISLTFLDNCTLKTNKLRQ